MASALHWVPMETVWEYSVQPRSSEWLVDIDAGEWLTSGVNGTFPSYLFEDLVSGVIYDATVYARTTLNLPKSGQDKPPQFRLACSCEYPALVFVNRMPFDRMCGSSLSNTLEGAVEMGSRSNNADQILLPLSPLSVGLHWLLPERKHQFVLPKCRIDASKTVSETRSLRSGQRRLLQASTPATPSISPTVSISDTVSVSASVSASASLASVSVTPSITPSISITPTPYPSGPDQIPSTGDWLYYDVGNVPTGAWTSTSYDDSAWANGRTPAGTGPVYPLYAMFSLYIVLSLHSLAIR